MRRVAPFDVRQLKIREVPAGEATGAGWTISAGFAATPFSRALFGQGPRGVCWLSFCGGAVSLDAAWGELSASWPEADLKRDDKAAAGLAGRIFGSRDAGPARPLRAVVRGTAFQVRVWRALLRIPFGEVRSYGELARALGAPQSARAVGNAVARNDISYLIPCHRIVKATGSAGHYRWGATLKKEILAWERDEVLRQGTGLERIAN